MIGEAGDLRPVPGPQRIDARVGGLLRLREARLGGHREAAVDP